MSVLADVAQTTMEMRGFAWKRSARMPPRTLGYVARWGSSVWVPLTISEQDSSTIERQQNNKHAQLEALVNAIKKAEKALGVAP